MRARLALPVVLALTLASCSAAPERTRLTQFFAASRLRDLTALRNLGTVVFEPTIDGIVTSFDLLGITVVQARDGHPVSEDVLIAAPVRLPDSRTVVKTFVVTMQRSMPGANQIPNDAWMITAIQPRPASPSIPPS
jgi:hypothetical protein